MQAPIHVVLGPRGSGKSTLARWIAGDRRPRIVLDPEWEHEGQVVDELWLAQQAVSDRLTDGVWRVCTKSREVGDDVAAAALSARGGLLLVDEADIWVTQTLPEDSPWVEQVERGRHHGVALILLTRRPARFWRGVTANADWLYCPYTVEPRDRQFLRAFGRGGGVLEQVDRLGEHEFLAVPRFGAPRVVRAPSEAASGPQDDESPPAGPEGQEPEDGEPGEPEDDEEDEL